MYSSVAIYLLLYVVTFTFFPESPFTANSAKGSERREDRERFMRLKSSDEVWEGEGCLRTMESLQFWKALVVYCRELVSSFHQCCCMQLSGHCVGQTFS